MSEPSAAAGERAGQPLRWGDLVILTKPRITLMVVLTAGLGAFMASTGELSLLLLLHTLLGTALVSGGASALNQVVERDTDKLMRRTAQRPIPAGRMSSGTALVFSLAISLGGVIYLAVSVNWLTAALGVAALVSYLLLYTPLKRYSSLSTLVGAVPGAIPPMMGWAAVTDRLDPGAWALFGILFFWQLPHFLAIAWLCREDYGRAGFPMLPVTDVDGRRTGRQMVLYSLALLPVSLLPTALELTGQIYLVGALVLGLLMVWYSLGFVRQRDDGAARRLMLYSVLYLPAVLVVMLVDRVL